MKTSLQGKFDPHNPLLVERLLTDVGEQCLTNKIGGQIRVEPITNAPDALVIYKVHAGNGVYVVRFALAAWREEILKNETCIAEQISPLTRVEIPETVFFPADDGIPAFTIHQWILGEPLTTEMYLAMSDKCKRQFVDDLADFLIAVHSIDIQETTEWDGWSGWNVVESDFGKPRWFDQELRKEIRALLTDRLGPDFARAANNTVDEFEQLVVDQADMAFVHGDIHGFNLAMRSGIHGYELSGIFDLENAGILDIHEDFFRLYFIAPELVDQTISTYNEKSINRKPLDNQRINLFWRTFLLYLMMENLEPENLACFQLYENMFVNTIKA